MGEFLFTIAFCLAAAPLAQAQTPFSISSADFQDGGIVPKEQAYNGGDCHGANRSPAISWQHAPPGTARFAVTLFDRDAPGGGWWLWSVADIPASIRHLPANASASGALAAMGAVQARNDFDESGYSGPCPPPGTVHRYVLTVYALKSTDLRVASDRPARFFEHEIDTDTLAKASMTVRNRVTP